MFALPKRVIVKRARAQPASVQLVQAPANVPRRLPVVRLSRQSRRGRPRRNRFQQNQFSTASQRPAGVPIQMAPVSRSLKPVSISLSHSERIGAVQAIQTRTNSQILVNPRKTECFPWLAGVARAFDMYRFARLSFEFVPSCPTTTAGEFSMGLDYDPLDDDSNIEITSMGNHVVGQLYARHTVTFQPRDTVTAVHKYFCDSGAANRLSDTVKLVYCAQSSAVALVGSLFVHYTVNFYNPEAVPDTYTRSLNVKHSDGTQDSMFGVVANVTATAAAATDTIQQLKNLGTAAATALGVLPAANTAHGGVVSKTDLLSGKLFPVQVLQHEWSITPEGVLSDDGEAAFTDSAGTAAIWLDADVCTNFLVLAPFHGNWTSDNTAAPTASIRTSSNVTVTAVLWRCSPSTFVEDVETDTFITSWFRCTINSGDKAWVVMKVTGGIWEETASTHTQVSCIVNQDAWNPVYPDV